MSNSDLKDLGLNGQFNKLPTLSKDVIKGPSSVMNMEAVVENKPQELRKLRPFKVALIYIPPGLPPESQIVLQAFFSSFEKSTTGVQEGLFEDIVFGFEAGGIPPECSVNGLLQLREKGYIKFQAPDNSYISGISDKIAKSWVRYQPKFMEIVYEDTSFK